MLAASELLRQVFTVVYVVIRGRSAEIVRDQDVAVPAIDVSGQGPTTIARDGERSRDSVTGHRERQLTETLNATVREVVEIQLVRSST